METAGPRRVSSSNPSTNSPMILNTLQDSPFATTEGSSSRCSTAAFRKSSSSVNRDRFPLSPRRPSSAIRSSLVPFLGNSRSFPFGRHGITPGSESLSLGPGTPGRWVDGVRIPASSGPSPRHKRPENGCRAPWPRPCPPSPRGLCGHRQQEEVVGNSGPTLPVPWPMPPRNPPR